MIHLGGWGEGYFDSLVKCFKSMNISNSWSWNLSMWKVSKSMTIFDNYQTEIKKNEKLFLLSLVLIFTKLSSLYTVIKVQMFIIKINVFSIFITTIGVDQTQAALFFLHFLCVCVLRYFLYQYSSKYVKQLRRF